MMHHPNMHHQQMSGHPPQHMGGHQGMPGHHQLPPHQLHRENRHVTLTRVPLGPSGAGALGAHGQALGGMGPMGVHHPPAQRPPHPIRAMPHHPQPQHIPMKQLRRPYGAGGAYGGGGAGGAVPPPYAPPPMSRAPHQPVLRPPHHNVVSTQPSTTMTTTPPTIASESVTADTGNAATGGAATAPAAAGAGACAAAAVSANTEGEEAATGDTEAACPSAASQANSKEKTPMCLVNELARYNKIKHQYRLTSETGPAHKKVFTVTLRLSDSEEYTAEGSSIKRAQHAAATAALAATSYPPPPQRTLPTHSAAHPHHRHSVMPTVELNALAMKLCQPAVYTSLPPVTRLLRPRAGPFRAHAMVSAFPAPTLVYRVRVSVGDQAWLGEGATPQAARHDAAARALHDLRPPPGQRDAGPPPPADTDTAGEQNADLLNAEVKSPVSLVHEIALKRSLTVHFTVKSERGPPHMRVFVTACTVGDMETEGEGNGKKVSKRRAAERMLDEMRRRWPPAILRARPPGDKRRHQPAKKKPRNLIKENGTTGTGSCGADNPISRLAVARHAVRARSPQYRVLEERGVARRREFVVQCDAPPHCAVGLGPNKKTAKRRAAHNVLMAMEMGASASNTVGLTGKATKAGANSAGDPTNSNTDTKRKDGDMPNSNGGGGANSEVRQPVPGVLLMDYQKRTGQPHQPNGVSETSATGAAGGSAHAAVHCAKDKLMYLSELLGFTVQFSDFPKRNHGEYLSLVSLSTEPPVMCHGGGPSTAHSHEQCSRAALRSLSMMGLDAPAPGMASAAGASHKPPGAGAMPGAGIKAAVSGALAD